MSGLTREHSSIPGFRDLLAKVNGNIREVDPAEGGSRLGAAAFLDVRELDEFEQGTVPGAAFIPRGHLESQVKGKAHATLADRSGTTR